jgi:hypothetical protein
MMGRRRRDEAYFPQKKKLNTEFSGKIKTMDTQSLTSTK